MAENNKKRCPQCGGELPTNAPGGMCPQCLMAAGLRTEAGGESPPKADCGKAVPGSGAPRNGFVPPDPKQLAGQFPQLEILKLLGKGGMGAVYRARQKQLDRLVALKILPGEVGRDEAFAERFIREARSLARLNHPGIVSVFDFGQTDDGLYYFLMEYVDGTDLRRVIESGRLKPEKALAIVPRLCEALQYAHKKGIVHRDIKPENILLDTEGHVKIADFGIARLLDKPPTSFTLTEAGQRMGTPHYMAPEQIEGAHLVDHRADIYSLGVVFYEMLTGELPIGRFAPPSKKARVDARLDEIVLHTLEKEPELRYQQVSQVKTDVEKLCGGRKTPAADSRPPVQRPVSSVALEASQPSSATITPEHLRSTKVSNKPIGYIIWLTAMCLAAVIITVGFFSLIVPLESRGAPFYFAVSLICAAELVCFAWLANYRLSRYFQIRCSGATRITIHVLIIAYFFLTLIVALQLAPSPEESTRLINWVTLLYAAGVFLLLFGAGMLYAKDINLQGETAEIQRESRVLKLMQVDVEWIRTSLREKVKTNEGDVAAADRVVKKIEALQTSLQYAPGKKPGTFEQDDSSVADINDKINIRITALTQSVADMDGPGGFDEKLKGVDATVNEIEMLLKQRQQRLLV